MNKQIALKENKVDVRVNFGRSGSRSVGQLDRPSDEWTRYKRKKS